MRWFGEQLFTVKPENMATLGVSFKPVYRPASDRKKNAGSKYRIRDRAGHKRAVISERWRYAARSTLPRTIVLKTNHTICVGVSTSAVPGLLSGLNSQGRSARVKPLA